MCCAACARWCCVPHGSDAGDVARYLRCVDLWSDRASDRLCVASGSACAVYVQHVHMFGMFGPPPLVCLLSSFDAEAPQQIRAQSTASIDTYVRAAHTAHIITYYTIQAGERMRAKTRQRLTLHRCHYRQHRPLGIAELIACRVSCAPNKEIVSAQMCSSPSGCLGSPLVS